MTINESWAHTKKVHPWTVTHMTTPRGVDYVPVTISVEAYNLPQFKDVVDKHAQRVGSTPMMDGQPKKPRKRGTITLTTQPHEVATVQAIVAELEAMTAR